MSKPGSDVTLRQLAPWMGVMLLLISLPYLLVWLQAPPGQTFMAGLINPDDVSVYLAAMRQGSEGAWLFQFSFSPEPIPPRLTYPLYLLMGRFVGLLHGSFTLWFHLFRLLASLFTLLAMWWWVRLALPGRARWQQSAWLLIAFGGGLGWLVAILLRLDFKQLPDLGRAEWGLLQPLLDAPHFALGMGLEVLLFVCVGQMVRTRPGWPWAVGGAFVALMLGLTYPYLIPVAGLVIGLYMLSLALPGRAVPWRAWGYGAVVLAPLLPLFYYFGIWARQDPNWEFTHITNNLIRPPGLPALAVTLGLLGVLGVIGLAQWRQSGQDWLVPIWAVANGLALYVPVPFAGRFLLGLVVPAGTLAAYGLEAWLLPRLESTRFFQHFSRLTPTPYASLRRVFLLLTIPSTLMVLVLLIQSPAVRPDYPLFLPDADMAAAQWLAETAAPDSLILAHYPVGNYFPRLAGSRVFVGQPYLTLDLEGKVALVTQFWDEATPAGWRDAFIQEWGIDYVYYGSQEQAISRGRVVPPGDIVYQADGVTIYQIVGQE